MILQAANPISPEQQIELLVGSSRSIGGPAFSFFVEPDIVGQIRQVLASKVFHFEVWGGYPHAERLIIGLDTNKAIGNMQKNDDRISSEPPTIEFPIAPVLIRASESTTRLSPLLLVREILKSGLNPESTGDIIDTDEGLVVFVHGQYAKEFRDSIIQIGSSAVITKADQPAKYSFYEPAIEIATAASNRLDAFVASIFRISRDDGRSAVRNAMVKINGAVTTKATNPVGYGDEIDLETRGRARISSLEETSKGRLRIGFRRYKRYRDIL